MAGGTIGSCGSEGLESPSIDLLPQERNVQPQRRRRQPLNGGSGSKDGATGQEANARDHRRRDTRGIRRDVIALDVVLPVNEVPCFDEV